MNVFSIISFIINHPLNRNNKLKAIKRFFKWQINSRINAHPILYAFTEKANLIVQKGMTGATGNLYCGLHEFGDMSFLLHLLREEDHFLDIGANIGSYTVLASAHVGAKTISIEPVPSTFLHLQNNIFINQIHERVKALNIALGSKKGTVNFTTSLDTVNHVTQTISTDTINVSVEKLDDILNEKEIPILIKIDVEGFETDVLNGATSTLQKSELNAIIIELNGSGSRYGYDEGQIHNRLINHGFKPYFYHPFERRLEVVDSYGSHNTIYIRNLAFVQERLKSASPVKILNQSI